MVKGHLTLPNPYFALFLLGAFCVVLSFLISIYVVVAVAVDDVDFDIVAIVIVIVVLVLAAVVVVVVVFPPFCSLIS